MPSDRTSVSVYLLKDAKAAEFRAAVVEGQHTRIPLASGLDGFFIPFSSPPRQPEWVGAVRQLIQDPASLQVTGQSAGGLMEVNRQERTFVICFGHAWLRLKPDWVVHDFGRRVALNGISKDKLIEVNAEQVFAKWHLARERAPRATALQEFGIESERDLVSAVEGLPTDSLLGPVLRGGTSVRVKVPLSTLGQVLDRLLKLYRSNAHSKNWPELHNLIPIADSDLIRDLDAALDSELIAGKGAKRIVLFAPSLRREDYAPPESYVFGRNLKNSPTAPYLLFGSWEGHLRRNGKTPSVQEARATAVHLLDDARQELATVSVYDCFGYETSMRGRQYVLSSGIWYEAGTDFQATINKRISLLQPPAIPLPAWDGASSEGEYNRRCAQSIRSLLHFDAKNVMYGGGQSKFEFCDLLHPPKRTLYFAKIPTKSSDLSHLTEQTRRTAELFFSADDSFRKALKRKMAKSHPKTDVSWLNGRPRAGDWDLCLVSLGRSASDLPFFAKCGLARLARDLEARGHSVSFQAV